MQAGYRDHVADAADLKGTILPVGKIGGIANEQGFGKTGSNRRKDLHNRIQNLLPPDCWVIPQFYLT